MRSEFSILEAQQKLHELIAQQHPLQETLTAIAEWIGSMMPGALVSIMRFDPHTNTLNLIPTQWFSEQYHEALQEIPVEADKGTCGTAAFERRLIITEDIQQDSRWDGYHKLAESENVRACWSMPIITSDEELLGTFATYYRSPTYPTLEAQKYLTRGASLVALAILRHRDARKHLTLSEWHRSLFENHPDGVYTFDLEGHFQSCNGALEEITGHAESDVIGLHFNQFIEPDYREQTLAAFNRSRDGETVTYETVGTHASGHRYFLEITNFPVVIEEKIVGVYGICRDISDRKHQDTELRQLKRGIEASPHGVLMADALAPDMPVVYANPAFTAITGYSNDDIVGRNCRFLQGEETDPESIEAIRQALRDKTDVELVLRNYRKDGSLFWNHLLISPVFDAGGTCTHFIGIQQDITRQKEQEAQITFQATHDVLTGLPNQAAFSDLLNKVLESPREQKKWLVALHLDLDGFKPINEGLGHHVGNQVLVTVSARLREVVGNSGSIARLVGDEFAVLLTGFQNRNEIAELADRILTALSEPIEAEHQLIHLSASMGIACNRLPIEAPHELMQYSDLALQKAKRQGKNTWQWYDGHKARSVRHTVALRHDLYRALEEEQFELHYQPLVDAVSGRVRSVEALVRWRHPLRGIVSPAEFIPLAEQTGQIVPMGRWILKQACKEIAALNAQNERAIPVAVNISSLQFLRDGFLNDVRAALDEASVAPMFLELEVTESVLLDGAEPVIQLMNTLKNMGIRVSLDDFGTGFSSLSYLRDLPTDKVKLDRSFVQNVDSDQRIAAIVQGVITMAHHMDMVVVAEGIETHEQQLDLARRHCDLLQGFYFARPMPMSELRKLPDALPAHRNW